MKANIHRQIFKWIFLKNILEIIENQGIKFIHPKDFKKSLSENKKDRKILFTVDDGLLSFYKNAWPILREKNPIYLIC